nr:MAG TPA: hypothetical protein [Caudoviricetes sp.]
MTSFSCLFSCKYTQDRKKTKNIYLKTIGFM